VVAVPVRVQNETRFFRAESFQGFGELRRNLRVIVVHNQNTVRADGRADVSAAPLQKRDIAADFLRFDRDVLPVFVLVVGENRR
jgi:hypothetical protein